MLGLKDDLQLPQQPGTHSWIRERPGELSKRSAGLCFKVLSWCLPAASSQELRFCFFFFFKSLLLCKMELITLHRKSGTF